MLQQVSKKGVQFFVSISCICFLGFRSQRLLVDIVIVVNHPCEGSTIIRHIYPINTRLLSSTRLGHPGIASNAAVSNYFEHKLIDRNESLSLKTFQERSYDKNSDLHQ